MKQKVMILFVLGVVLLVSPSAFAETEMPTSVVGSGGGVISGANYEISNTLGQAAVGFMSGPYHSHYVGFWGPPKMLTPVEHEDSFPGLEYRLGQNYPNPFNPVTSLQFAVPVRSPVTIRLYDVNGREMMTVVDECLDPGRYTRVVDAGALASGIYFCRMQAGAFVETRKMVLLR